MDSIEGNGSGTNGNGANILPPPPPVPENVVPLKAESDITESVKKKIQRVPIARRGLASKGSKIPILTNHFKVNVTNVEGYFFHYSVCEQDLLYNQGFWTNILPISVFCMSTMLTLFD